MEHSAVADQVQKSKVAKPESSSGDQQHHTADYAPYPMLDPADLIPPPPPLATGTAARSAASGDFQATTMPAESNPYVTPTPAATSSSKSMLPDLDLFFQPIGFRF